ncbi:uncharacterized protein LOC128996867 isoform X2 [Macrosteles quadrilineatus]|uniref:uncharacterized protein LOC128996867 isoform X2 n=1 Tax=Macrosteles quadrilineatus TaxID=74068 RepID=UPI0023E0B734|nr:uncharacterized protein LOC128996867 isoform X2 [Macrosteles quadrilineatus]
MLLLALFFAGITAVLADDEKIMDVGKCKDIDDQELMDIDPYAATIHRATKRMLLLVLFFAGITAVLADDEKLMDVGKCKDIDDQELMDIDPYAAAFLSKPSTWAVKFTTITKERSMGLNSMVFKVERKNEIKTYLKFEWQLLGGKGGPGQNSQQELQTEFFLHYLRTALSYAGVAKPNIDARYVIFSEGDVSTEEVKDVAKVDEDLMQRFGFSKKLVFVT